MYRSDHVGARSVWGILLLSSLRRLDVHGLCKDALALSSIRFQALALQRGALTLERVRDRVALSLPGATGYIFSVCSDRLTLVPDLSWEFLK